MSRKLSILLLFTLLLLTACPQEKITCHQGINLRFPVRVTPIEETTRVGDTLRIEVAFDQILDDDKDTVYGFSEEIYFNFSLNIARIDTSPWQWAVANFEVIDSAGNSEEIHFNGGTYLLNLSYEDNWYRYEGRVVPNTPGLYFLSFDDRTFSPDNIILYKNCNYKYRVKHRINEGADNNFAYLRESPDTNIANMPREIFDDGVFVLKVVE